MAQLVTRLERDGLVHRTPSPSDRRVVLVEATPQGHDLVARRRRQRAATLGVLVDRLNPEDRDAVQHALPALNRLTELALTPQDQHRFAADHAVGATENTPGIHDR